MCTRRCTFLMKKDNKKRNQTIKNVMNDRNPQTDLDNKKCNQFADAAIEATRKGSCCDTTASLKKAV